ncbi:MAG TPA: carboxypeptidase regulatory-like domain-containing protein [Pyrinomonadaceae bacterium]|nr:carboxypeptidase regulatory-like domain-containing protein [Pyrinomonadaceae bacterium]
MKPKSKPFVIKMVFSVFFLFLLLFLSQSILAASTIQGVVYDKQRNALPDIDVELLNDYYQMIQRARTDGTGRYQFNGLGDGRYTVRVLAFRYDFQDQEMPIEISTQGISVNQNPGSSSGVGQGSGYFPQDFYLLPKKGGLKDAELAVVFAQEIPKEAETTYKKAIDNLAKKKTTEGIVGLAEAIQKFPTYYNALTRLGQELYINKKYVESVQYFLEAVKVNPKSATSFYYIGMGLNKLGKEYNKSAITALKQAVALAPASIVVLYMIGKIEREDGKFTEAEQHLLQAKKLSTVKVPEIHNELYRLYADDLKKYNLAADELELFLKATKLSDEDEKKVRKSITDLREKAKSQTE